MNKILVKSRPFLAALALAGVLAGHTASAASLDVGVGAGVPSSGLVPLNLNLSMPVFSVSPQASLCVRADMTTAFGSGLIPAFGVSGLFMYRVDTFEPFAGVGLSTVSLPDRVSVVPIAVFGASFMPGSVGVRMNGFVTYAADAVQFGASMNLVFRIGLGGNP